MSDPETFPVGQAPWEQPDPNVYKAPPPPDTFPVGEAPWEKEAAAEAAKPEPDMAPVTQMFNENLAKKEAEENAKPVQQPAGTPQPMKQAKTYMDALEAGFDMSVVGLMRQRPDVALAPDAGMAMRITSQVGQLAGDLPAMVAGGYLGGMIGAPIGAAAGTVVAGPAGTLPGVAVGVGVGQGAGAFALPEGLRTVMMQHYEKGDVKSFGDFWERSSAAIINSGKAAVIGGVTAGVGGVVAKATAPALASTTVGAVTKVAPAAVPPAIAAAQTTARLTAEVATMTTVGAAIEGHAPEPEHFLEAAILVGGMHAATSVLPKTYGIYAKTGMKPEEVAMKAIEDPHFRQQLLADNNQIPIKGEVGNKNILEMETVPTVKPLKNEKPLADLPPELPAEPSATPNSTPVVQTPEQIILSKVGTKAPKAKKGMSISQLYTNVVDKLDPINEATKVLKSKTEELTAEQNPYINARVAVDAKAKAKHFFEKGVLDQKTKEIVSEPLRNILESVDSVESLDAYSISKRVVEKEAQGIKMGFDLEAAKKVVEQGRGKYEGAHQRRVKFQNGALKYAKDAGILSEKQYNNMVEANKDYIPFKRLLEAEDGSGKAGGKAGSLKKMTGSEADIQSPTMSVVENTIELITMAENNRPKRAMIELAAKDPNQTLITKVPERMQPIQVKAAEIVRALEEQGAITTLESIKRDLKERGLKISDETLAAAFEKESPFQSEAIKDMLIFRKQKLDLGKNQFDVMIDGKRQVFETTPELAEAFARLGGDSTSMNIVLRVARGFTVVKKYGITMTPDFILRNFERDMFTASTFTKGRGINPLDVAVAMKDIITKSDSYYEWLKSGGANGAFIEMNESYIKRDLYKLEKETSILGSFQNLAAAPLDLMRVAAEVSEQSLRIAEFKKVRKQGGTLTEAGFASREITIDFQRIGAQMSSMNAITAFMNVSIQGLDRTARAFKENPTGSTLKAFTYITMPSVLLWWVNKDDERVKQIPQVEKDMNWIIATDNWKEVKPEEADSLPSYMVRTENGKVYVNKGNIYRIPKPQEIGLIFGTAFERMLDKWVADKPDAAKDMDKSIGGLIMPNMVPDAIAPVVEQYMNKSFFSGRDIVPHHLKEIQPQYRFVEYTSETAKVMGKMVATIDKSVGPYMPNSARKMMQDTGAPVVLQNYARSWGGALGQYALQVSDKALIKSGMVPDIPKPADTLSDVPFVKSFVVRFPRADTNEIQNFYDNFEKSQRVWATIEHLGKQADFDSMEQEMNDPENKENMAKLDGVKKGLAAQAAIIRNISKDPDMSRDEKRQMIDGAYLEMTEIARMGNDMMNQMKQQAKEE